MREVRVGSVQPHGMSHLSPFDGETDRARARRMVEDNVGMACRLLTQAGDIGCDVVCYPEDVQGIAHYGYYLDDPDLFTGLVETVPGPTAERVAEVARRCRMNVVFGVFEREGDRIYNTAVLLGRSGEILGKYHKVHLPAVEAWTETHGDAFPVFETDFGAVGMLICYDILFPEAARCLVLNGAELLLNPTMSYEAPGECEGGGLMRVRMRALDNYTPLAVSQCGHGTVVVDARGDVVAHAAPEREEVIAATMDLDAGPRDHSQWEVFTGTADVKARLMQERHPEAYASLVSPHPRVLDRYRHERLRSSPAEIRVAYEEIRSRWSGAP